MLYRFREAQAAELGLVPKKRERRPALASSVNTVGECEKWRRQLLNMIARKVSKIQDGKYQQQQQQHLEEHPITLFLYSQLIRLPSTRPER